MDPAVLIAIILAGTSIVTSIIAAIAAVVAAFISHSTRSDVAVVRTEFNGMKDALVESTKNENLAVGEAIGREAERAETSAKDNLP